MSAGSMLTLSISYESNVGLEAVQVDEDIDAMRREGIHATRVLSRLVDMVDPDGVGTELVHQCGIALALLGLDKRIIFDELVSNA